MSTTPPQSAAQPIPAASHHHGRARSASVYSISSLPALSNSPSVSPNSPTLPQLSPSLTGKSLSAIFSGPQSPLKSNSFFSGGGGFGGGGGGGGPGIVMEDDDHDHDDFHGELPASPPRSHTRHSSISWGSAPRFATSEMDNRIERGSGLLRRLSLGSAFRPNPSTLTSPSPPQTIAAPTPRMSTAPAVPLAAPVARKLSPGNSLGLGGLASPAQDPIKKRGVSPMGERMLKGHFDGFN